MKDIIKLLDVALQTLDSMELLGRQARQVATAQICIADARKRLIDFNGEEKEAEDNG